jgi:murein DD-endopeptidase MepM/ murein hydrolase activator NlpD
MRHWYTKLSSSLLAAGVFALWSMPASAVPALRLPFPCGQSYQVTQDHNGGSHTGKGAWAWDFGIGVGGVVTAPADGTIRMVRMDSTRHGCDSAYANDANYVVLDFGDGTEALFLHMKANSSRVSVGDQVQQGDPIAEVGNSGWVCGTHLHFQIQNTCNSWWCQSVQASFVDHGDPQYPATVTSNNCQQPPPVCTVPASSERVIDEQEDCFRQQTSYWWDESGGWDNHWYYTYAISGSSDTVGSWHFEVEQTARYEVHVHIPGGAQSTQAKYYIDSPIGTQGPFEVDQTAHNGWVKLGEFSFEPGKEYALRLPDNTGESFDNRVKLAFDAVRVRPYDPPDPDPDTGTADTGTMDSGPSDTGSADTGAVDTGLSDTTDPDTGSSDAGSDVTRADASGGDIGDAVDAGGVDDDGNDGRHVTSTGGCSTAGGEGGAAPLAPWMALFWIFAALRATRTTPPEVANRAEGRPTRH